MANSEIQNLVSACGTGLLNKFDYSKLRYGKIIIMTDADVDGAHICTLLLTFFYRCMPEIIRNGHLFIAQPPLYRIDVGKKLYYAVTEEEKDKIVKNLNGTQFDIGRFKGLGEMPASDLRETTMNKKSRSLIKVALNNAGKTSEAVSQLMGKNAESRYIFIKQKAEFAKDLDV